MSYLVISRKSKILAVWYFGYILCCLLSSYFYIYIAAFQHKDITDKWWIDSEIYFEAIFFISIILNFLTDYQDESNHKEVRDLSNISMRYLRGNFAWEFLPLIPFPHVMHYGFKNPNHFYIIKVVRLMTAQKVFDPTLIYEKIKAYHMRNLHWIAENDPVLAED